MASINPSEWTYLHVGDPLEPGDVYGDLDKMNFEVNLTKDMVKQRGGKVTLDIMCYRPRRRKVVDQESVELARAAAPVKPRIRKHYLSLNDTLKVGDVWHTPPNAYISIDTPDIIRNGGKVTQAMLAVGRVYRWLMPEPEVAGPVVPILPSTPDDTREGGHYLKLGDPLLVGDMVSLRTGQQVVMDSDMIENYGGKVTEKLMKWKPYRLAPGAAKPSTTIVLADKQEGYWKLLQIGDRLQVGDILDNDPAFIADGDERLITMTENELDEWDSTVPLALMQYRPRRWISRRTPARPTVNTKRFIQKGEAMMKGDRYTVDFVGGASQTLIIEAEDLIAYNYEWPEDMMKYNPYRLLSPNPLGAAWPEQTTLPLIPAAPVENNIPAIPPSPGVKRPLSQPRRAAVPA